MSDDAAAASDFVSYSRRDALELGKMENEWFVQFRHDLLRDVAREAHLPTIVPPERVGFYDRENIHNGDRWTDALADALQTSRVIVCMFSANYFLSANCGREFQVFRDRVREAAEDPWRRRLTSSRCSGTRRTSCRAVAGSVKDAAVCEDDAALGPA